MTERALSFGSFAREYERYRPGYPGEVADRIAAYAGRPLRTALEIGAGTGKATRVLASRGIAVTASEPDAAMLDELRKHVPDSVTPVWASFEEMPLDREYDLVFAAAALHWTRLEGRWEREAALLPSGGVFASFGGPMWLADAEVEAAVRAARSDVVGSDDVPAAYSTATDAPMQWPGTELEATASFTSVEQHVLPRRATMTAHAWIGHLSTVSAYLVLSERDRVEVFRRIGGALPGRVEVVGDVVLHLARRI
jgi:SAM-dependent methyltransferase